VRFIGSDLVRKKEETEEKRKIYEHIKCGKEKKKA
jgi:hypothetical protein